MIRFHFQYRAVSFPHVKDSQSQLPPLLASSSCFGLEELRYQLFVRQPLAFDASQGEVRALLVRNLERSPIVVAEVELSEIALQVRLAAMLVGADHSALEHGEHAFNRVRVGVATLPLPLRVVHRLV